eukprot:1328464-Amphidinium_carterae.5
MFTPNANQDVARLPLGKCRVWWTSECGVKSTTFPCSLQKVVSTLWELLRNLFSNQGRANRHNLGAKPSVFCSGYVPGFRPCGSNYYKVAKDIFR